MSPSIDQLADGRVILTFPASSVPFVAAQKAERYPEARGFSVGRPQAHAPRGILLGHYDIQKWRNLRPIERASLHGSMTGDGRHGPIQVQIRADAPTSAREAILSPASRPPGIKDRVIAFAADTTAIVTITVAIASVLYVGLYPIWSLSPASHGKFALRATSAPDDARAP